MNFNIHISYQDQDVLVRPLFEKSDHLFIDAHGAIYQKTWKRDKRATKNPNERKQLKFDFNDLLYSRYSDGILSLRRALLSAISSSDVTIISHKEWLELVEEFHQDILAYDLDTFSGYEPALMKMTKEVSQLRTQVMKEVFDQLVSIVRLQDSQGRYNTSALCARSVAVQERIIERLKGVRAWQFHFTTQSVLIENEWKRFGAFIASLSIFAQPKTVTRLSKMSGNEEIGMLGEMSNWFHKANYYASFTFYPREMTQLASALDVLVDACNSHDKIRIARAHKVIQEVLVIVRVLMHIEGIKVSMKTTQHPSRAYVKPLQVISKQLDTLYKKSGNQWIMSRSLSLMRGVVGAIASSRDAVAFEEAMSVL